MRRGVRAVRQLGALALGLSVAAGGVAVGFIGGWQVQGWRWRAADADRIEAEHEAARLKSTALARGAERNDRETTDQLRRALVAAAAARDDLERLRNAAAGIGPADPGAACEPDDGRLGRLASLLAEGAGLVEEGGRRVEQLAAEKAGLQRDAAELRRVLVSDLPER
jgi:hypothetical protein